MSIQNLSSQSKSGGQAEFVRRFAENMGMEYAEARMFLKSMMQSPARDETSEPDKYDLMLAVNMNARLRGVHEGAQFKRFKFMLNNNSQKALNLARKWMAEQISFDEMLVSF